MCSQVVLAAQDVHLLVSLLNPSGVSSQKKGVRKTWIHGSFEVSPDAPSRLQPSGRSGVEVWRGGVEDLGLRCQITTQQFGRGQMMRYGKHPASCNQNENNVPTV